MLELSHGHPLALSLLVEVLSQRQEESGRRAVGVGRGARRSGAAGGELPGRRAEPAPSAGARMRGARAAYHGGPAGQRVRRSRGRRSCSRGCAACRSWSTGRTALFPHDLARERDRRRPALARPGRVSGAALGRCVAHVVERIGGKRGRERGRALADLIFLHRGNPAAAAFWDWKSLGEVYADGLRGGDRRRSSHGRTP